ncbi:glycoside hydrolase family 48 protein [Hahella ganghwensis]|uniref:glycoside hydrolase family 48 protein n=1 Tax=Hahella ganghwensis TaxID=286420 RepID=UPI0003A53C77|nr:glycoside hydrolase family 48 protein [Hahella ganghwensis]
MKLRPIRKIKLLPLAIAMAVGTMGAKANASADEYDERFMEMWSKIHSPDNGYFSTDGGPYHSVETLIVEAPDHGHESTSEAYSYYLLLEAWYGKVTGDWSKLREAWQKMEEHIIPTPQMQPTNNYYNPSNPASYAAEHPAPSNYPSQLEFGIPVGEDPISARLAQTYGTWDIYGMHWLLDMDNIYGYGNLGDGVSTPSYINTFQRGEQESVWEAVPHPSWETFQWGGPNGFLDLFTGDNNYARQWRYTNAPDADARAVQVIYWAYQWIKEQGKDPEQEIPGLLAKAAKMGDYLRLAMFDKYFKKMGAQNKYDAGARGYESAHYLMSWYYAWGGAADPNAGWAFRIGSSHVHFGYQNPIAAMALSDFDPMKPQTPGATEDWAKSLERMMEFYRWLQSAEGAIAGGATNSWDGDYQPHPQNLADSTFYGMVYDENPVYHDPGSGTWFGWQAWSMQRVAEYFYLTGDAQAKALLDNWVPWVMEHLKWQDDGTFQLPATLAWSGKPNKWNPDNPQANDDLHVSVVNYGQDLGIAGGVAKALMFYAAAEAKHASPQAPVQEAAKKLLDAIWTHFQTSKGLAAPEKRGDYSRFFDQVYVPASFNGHMPNGDEVNSNSTFLSLRSFYEKDPMFKEVKDVLDNGQEPEFTYHRFWAQVELATAYVTYQDLFGSTDDCQGNCVPQGIPQLLKTRTHEPLEIELHATDSDGEIVRYEISTPPLHGTLTGTGKRLTYTPAPGYQGTDRFEFTATDDDGAVSAPAQISINVVEATIEMVSPPNGSEYVLNDIIQIDVNKDHNFRALIELNDNAVATVEKESTSTFLQLPDFEGNHTLVAKLVDDSNTVIATSNEVIVVTTSPGAGGLDCAVTENVWNNGFVAYVTVTNNTNETVEGWTMEVPLSATDSFTNGWSAEYQVNGASISASHMSWNATIAPGASVNFGFQGSYSRSHAPLTCSQGS